MPRYIGGFYLEEDDTHLEQIRKVYDALEDLYPWGETNLRYPKNQMYHLQLAGAILNTKGGAG